MTIKDCIKIKEGIDPEDLVRFEKAFTELTAGGIKPEAAYTEAAEIAMESILEERNELASEIIGKGGYLEPITIENLLNPASFRVEPVIEVTPEAEPTATAEPAAAKAIPGDVDSINEKAATLGVSESDVRPAGAFHATSFSPEKREASWTRDYVGSMVNAWEQVEDKINDDNRERVTEQFERLKEGYAKRLNDYFSSHGRVMSSMITGPANFPVARNQKRIDAADKKLDAAFDWLKKGTQRLNKAVLAPVDASPKGQLAEAQAKLADREARQVSMKAFNAAHKKFLKDPDSLDKTDLSDEEKAAIRRYEPKYGWEPHPFAPYELTNNNAEIRRLKLRVKMLEGKSEKAEAAQPGDNSYKFEGGTVELNYEDDRLRILFDEKPGEEMRSQLKSHGFRWSPKAGAWQRKITPAATYDAGNILGVDFQDSKPSASRKSRLSKASLPMDKKSRLKRAREQGFDTSTVYYHGTNRDFSAFSKDAAPVFDNAQQALGYFFTGNSKYASRYTAGSDPELTDRRGGNVIPVYLKTKKLKEEDISLMDEIEGNEISGWTVEEVEEYKADLISQGYDGIRFKGHDEIVVFDPSQIRSINAAFDPAETESPDLLASRKGRPSKAEVETEGSRRTFLKAVLGVAMAGGAVRIGMGPTDLTTLGRAKPISDDALNQRVPAAAEKLLRADGSLPEVMRIIAKEGPEELRELALTLSKLIPKGKIKIVVDDKTRGVNHGTLLPGDKGAIMTLYTAGGLNGLNVSTVLHESLHAAVAARYYKLSVVSVERNYRFLGMSKAKADAAIRQFTLVWDEFESAAKKQWKKSGVVNTAVSEAVRSPDEFFVRALTDPITQEFMAGIEYKGKTLLQRFIDWIKVHLFGYKKTGEVPSWLDAALMAAKDVLDAMPADVPSFSYSGAVIKKTRKGVGPLSSIVDKPLFMRKDGPFYSSLSKGIGKHPQKKGTPAQWAGIIGKLSGVKKEEIEWSGVMEWLEARGKATTQEVKDGREPDLTELFYGDFDTVGVPPKKITKDEIIAFLSANEVQIEEVLKGISSVPLNELSPAMKVLLDQLDAGIISNNEFSDQAKELGYQVEFEMGGDLESITKDSAEGQAAELGMTRYTEQQLPGGKNPRELLLTMPYVQEDPAPFPRQVELDSLYAQKKELKESGNRVQHGKIQTKTVDLQREKNQWVKSELGRIRRSQPEPFIDSHYAEPNIVVWVRFNEREVDGKRVLFIEEIQSPWHQKGRKVGYGSAKLDESRIRKPTKEDRDFYNIPENEYPYAVIFQNYEGSWVFMKNRQHAVAAMNQEGRDRPPNAPFKTTWPLLAMKRMIRYAAENGFDQVAWTTGEQQADRYDLSKQVKEIRVEWSADANKYKLFIVTLDSDSILALGLKTKKELIEHVGKDLTDKIIEDVGEGKADSKRYTGLDLKVGGEGMKGFYDKMLVSITNKYIKKWGGKVGEISIAADPLGIAAGKVVYEVIDGRGEVQATYVRGEHNADAEDLANRQKESFERDERLLKETPAFTAAAGMRIGPYKVEKRIAVENDTPVHAFDITPEMRDSAMAGAPVFSQKKSRAGRSVKTVKNWIKAPLSRVKGVDIEVIESVAELRVLYPRNEIADDTVGMFFRTKDGGKIYLIAGNTRNKREAHEVLAHELVGHLGLEKVLGPKKFNLLLDEIARIKAEARENPGSHPEIEKFLKTIQETYITEIGEYALNDKQESMEILAHITEKRPRIGPYAELYNKIVNWFRNILSKWGFINVTRVDIGRGKESIEDLIETAVQYVKGITPTRTEPTVGTGIAARGGLPMDKASRERRAEEQGFTVEAFHSTTADIGVFEKHPADLGYHFGTTSQANKRLKDKEGDRRYESFLENSRTLPPSDVIEGANVIPVKLKLNNPLRLPDVGDWRSSAAVIGRVVGVIEGVSPEAQPIDAETLAVLEKIAVLYEDVMEAQDQFEEHEDFVDTPENEEFMEEARAIIQLAGYDGIVYNNIAETPWKENPKGEDSYIVFEPEQIRSVHAAFGPEKGYSADIMAMRTGKPGQTDLFAEPETRASAISRKGLGHKEATKRIPELQTSMQDLMEGKVPISEYDRMVNEHKPVDLYDEVPIPATPEEMRKALSSNKVDRIGAPAKELAEGTPVGLRLDIPAYTNHGIWVVSVHGQKGGFEAGKVYGYDNVAQIKNATFGSREKTAQRVAAGGPKSTMATIKGEWVKTTRNDALRLALESLISEDWTQVGFDPERHSYFWDRGDMRPVVAADEVIQIGPLVLAKNPQYAPKDDFLYSRKSRKPRSKAAGAIYRTANAIRVAYGQRTSPAKRQIWGVLTLRQTAEQIRPLIPTIYEDYLRHYRRMETIRNIYQSRAGEIAGRRRKLTNFHNDQLSIVQHESTIAGVDGDVPYEPLIDPLDAAQQIGVINEQMRGRSGQDNSVLLEKRKEINFKLKQENNRRKIAPRILKIFHALNAEQKNIYRAERKFHVDLRKAIRTALLERIEEAFVDESIKGDMMVRLRTEFELTSVQPPYFPLARFGEFWVHSKIQGTEYYDMFETEGEWKRHHRQLAEAGDTILGAGKNAKDEKTRQEIPPDFITRVDKIISKLGDHPRIGEIRDEVYQLYLESLPELSARKHAIHRSKMRGFYKDHLRAFSHASRHGSNLLAKTKYGYRMQAVLADMELTLKMSSDVRSYNAIKEELDAYIGYLEEDIDSLTVTEIKTEAMRLRKAAEREAAAQIEIEPEEDGAAELYQRWLRYIKIKRQVGARPGSETTTPKSVEEILEERIHRRTMLLSMADNINREPDPLTARRMVRDALSELKASHEANMNPDLAPWSNSANALGFFWFLGYTPAAGVVNLVQTPAVALPVAAAKFGWGPVSKHMGMITAQVGVQLRKSKNHPHFGIEKLLKNEGERAAYQRWHDEGLLDKTLAHDLGGFAEEGIYTGQLKQRIMRTATYLFHQAERMNREVTALTVYRAAIDYGLGPHAAAVAAEEMVWRTHFDYTRGNRARFMRGNTMRVITQFKQYNQNISYLYLRTLQQGWGKRSKDNPAERAEARRTLFNMLLMQTLVAGLLGWPILEMLIELANLFDDDDQPEDYNANLKQWAHDKAGSFWGEAILKGLPTALGVDFHSRLTLSDLWYRSSDRELRGSSRAIEIIKTLGGPMASIGLDMFRGAELIRDAKEASEYLRALEAMIPKVGKDVLKGARYTVEGVRAFSGAEVVPRKEITKGTAAIRAFGFAPSSVSRAFDAKNAIQGLVTRRTQRKKAITHKLEVLFEQRIEQGPRGWLDSKLLGKIDIAEEAAKRWNKFNVENEIDVGKVFENTQIRITDQLRMKYGLENTPVSRDLLDRFTFGGQ